MSFVVDASIVVAWAFDEVSAVADEARELLRSEEAAVPGLWWFEVRNALIQGERRGRFSERRTERFLHDIARLPFTVNQAPSEAGVLLLARRHRLTVYDAAYLELALRLSAPLATLDAALGRAAARDEAAAQWPCPAPMDAAMSISPRGAGAAQRKARLGRMVVRLDRRGHKSKSGLIPTILGSA